MVDLVLQTGGEQALGLDLVRLAVEVLILDLDLRGPLDLLVIFRDREAAFLARRFCFRGPDGLTKICGSWASSFFDRSSTITRFGTPTWIAASPMPGALYMVSNMSSTSLRMLASTRLIGSETCRSRLSGSLMMSSTAMAGDVRAA